MGCKKVKIIQDEQISPYDQSLMESIVYCKCVWNPSCPAPIGRRKNNSRFILALMKVLTFEKVGLTSLASSFPFLWKDTGVKKLKRKKDLLCFRFRKFILSLLGFIAFVQWMVRASWLWKCCKAKLLTLQCLRNRGGLVGNATWGHIPSMSLFSFMKLHL